MLKLKAATGLMIVIQLLVSVSPSEAGELQAVIRDQNGQPVADAVVLARPADRSVALARRQPKDVVDQVDKEFVPYVKAIMVGSLVHFPNKDNIRHHVYSFSAPKKFELPLYAGTAAAPVLFDKPGVVVLGCNIHDWMIGYIYVSETPLFGKSEQDGKVTIDDLPAGEYTVRVWHPRMEATEESTSRRLVLGASAPANVEWQLTLKPAFRIPRVSGGKGAGYR